MRQTRGKAELVTRIYPIQKSSKINNFFTNQRLANIFDYRLSRFARFSDDASVGSEESGPKGVMMTFDREERRKQALKQELDRGRKYAASKGMDHAESAKLTHKHVDGLAAMLLPNVRSALRGEVTSEALATEMVSDARTVATWLLRTGAVDVNALENADKSKSSADSLRDGMVRLKNFFGFESEIHQESAPSVSRFGNQVEMQLIDSLEAKLKDATHYEVREEEVEEHSGDLARLLISNWFGVLEDAVEEQPGTPVKLEYRAFPPSVSAGVVTEGCEGFALPTQLAISKVFEYQQSLAALGESVTLSPIVSLYRSKSGPWYAYHTKSSKVLAALRSTDEPVRAPFQLAVARANEAFSPIAIGRAMQFQGSLSLNTALVHRCSYVAANIVRRHLHESLGQLDPLAPMDGSEEVDVMSPKLTKYMAHAILDDLTALAPPSAFSWAKNMQHVRRAASLPLGEEENTFLGDAYMLALPATAVLLAEYQSDQEIAMGAESIIEFEYQQEIEPLLLNTTVAIVSSAMIEASTQSGQEALGRKLRTMMEPGHEPSGFALLAGR